MYFALRTAGVPSADHFGEEDAASHGSGDDGANDQSDGDDSLNASTLVLGGGSPASSDGHDGSDDHRMSDDELEGDEREPDSETLRVRTLRRTRRTYLLEATVTNPMALCVRSMGWGRCVMDESAAIASTPCMSPQSAVTLRSRNCFPRRRRQRSKSNPMARSCFVYWNHGCVWVGHEWKCVPGFFTLIVAYSRRICDVFNVYIPL